ncbi:FecR domain-containing protein [Ideonella oryzae]|uniref:FecR domain-containing protein n=1 Tax=Ideonella oryzae TaxID=2937441 RepID=A0ABT1BK55_9BURK|nr:FecR domain-containing protein [Ideonella oryzae]MCO5976595.1 FecR domain-containing protein [Ideonella oryzae]
MRLLALRRLPGLLALCLPALSCLPSHAGPAPEPMLRYTVQPQDTLWDLSARWFRRPASWPEVARLNRLSQPDRLTPGQTLKLPLRLLKPENVPATLSGVEGQVLLDGQPAQAGAAIQPGQRVQAGADSSAVVQLGDGSRASLPPQSEVELVQHQRYTLKAAQPVQDEGLYAATLRLLRGTLEMLATQVQRAKPLEVTTPTAVIGVRGTRYRVHADAQQPRTQTEVLEGRVWAQTQARPPASATLDAGQGAVLRNDAPVMVQPLAAAPDLSGVPTRFERPLLRFTLPSQAGEVRVQIASDEGFLRIVRDLMLPVGAEARIAGLADGPWYLRARQVAPDGLEGQDAVHPFALKARPEPPPSTAPRPQARQSVGTVDFAWTSNTEAARYHLQVARDAGFQQIVAQQDALGDTTSSVTLDAPGTYHWRLASERADGDRGPWGDAQRFELRPLPEPPQVHTGEDGQIQLSWSARPDEKQQVELARDPGFSSVVTSAELEGGQWTLPSLPVPGTYYFRYRYVDDQGFVSPWTAALGVDVPVDWHMLLLGAPLLFAL